MNVLEDFDRTVVEVGEVVSGVKPEQFDDPTPCAAWNVRTVIAHLIGTPLEFAKVAAGRFPPEPTFPAVGDEPAAQFSAAVATAQQAFARPGMLEQRYEFPWGSEPGSRIVRHVANEVLIHGWDLARATGQPTDFSPDLADRSLASWREWFAEQPRGQMTDNFAAEQPLPPDAGPADRLAAYLGRSLG